mmetsp:Transcript_25125/g.62275  ORF Transcript_25125/g.62275 Transcript_25125/m.62275 type:complete len:325 (-) Transcript_25125:401-1375(-)
MDTVSPLRKLQRRHTAVRPSLTFNSRSNIGRGGAAARSTAETCLGDGAPGLGVRPCARMVLSHRAAAAAAGNAARAGAAPAAPSAASAPAALAETSPVAAAAAAAAAAALRRARAPPSASVWGRPERRPTPRVRRSVSAGPESAGRRAAARPAPAAAVFGRRRDGAAGPAANQPTQLGGSRLLPAPAILVGIEGPQGPSAASRRLRLRRRRLGWIRAGGQGASAGSAGAAACAAPPTPESLPSPSPCPPRRRARRRFSWPRWRCPPRRACPSPMRRARCPLRCRPHSGWLRRHCPRCRLRCRPPPRRRWTLSSLCPARTRPRRP